MISRVFDSGRPKEPAHTQGLNADSGRAGPGVGRMPLVPEDVFKRVVSMQQKRSERSRQPFVLMVVSAENILQDDEGSKVLDGITNALFRSTRETDLRGWYRNGSEIGVICTEIGPGSMASVICTLRCRVTAALRKELGLGASDKIGLSFEVFPNPSVIDGDAQPVDSTLCHQVKPADSGDHISPKGKGIG
jgi:hypothetical protein